MGELTEPRQSEMLRKHPNAVLPEAPVMGALKRAGLSAVDGGFRRAL